MSGPTHRMQQPPGSLHAIWSQLLHHLEQRSRALCEEVRHYPTPIAHCDEQLSGLIEQRTRALAQTRLLREAGRPDPVKARAWLETSRELADRTDAGECALRAQLEATLQGARRKRPRPTRQKRV